MKVLAISIIAVLSSILALPASFAKTACPLSNRDHPITSQQSCLLPIITSSPAINGATSTARVSVTAQAYFKNKKSSSHLSFTNMGTKDATVTIGYFKQCEGQGRGSQVLTDITLKPKQKESISIQTNCVTEAPTNIIVVSFNLPKMALVTPEKFKSQGAKTYKILIERGK